MPNRRFLLAGIYLALTFPSMCFAMDEARSNRIDELVDVKDYAAALEESNKLIEESPNDGQAYFNRGYLLLHYIKDNNKAIPDLSKAMELDDMPLTRFSRGEAYYQTGQVDKAISDYTIGLKNKDEIRNKVAQSNEVDQSIQDWVKPDDSEMRAYYYLGSAYVDKGLLNKAIASYTKAIALNYNDPNVDLHILRALAYYQQGEYSKALADINKSMELYPGSKMTDKIYSVRASVYLNLGEFDRCQADVLKAQELGYIFEDDFLTALKNKRIPKNERASEPMRNKFTSRIGESW